MVRSVLYFSISAMLKQGLNKNTQHKINKQKTKQNKQIQKPKNKNVNKNKDKK